MAPQPSVSLTRDYSFTQVRKMNIDHSFMLPAGEYRYFAEDEVGRYYIHTTRGVLLGGNLERPLKGGFFVPNDASKRLIIWWQPASIGTAVAILGPLGAAAGSTDPAKDAVRVIHIPDDISRNMRDDISLETVNGSISIREK